MLYGTTASGENPATGLDTGTVFRINTDGSGFAVVHYFDPLGGDLAGPYGDLTLIGDTLYGTTIAGSGGIYAITVPEPSSWVLAAVGLAAVALGRRRLGR